MARKRSSPIGPKPAPAPDPHSPATHIAVERRSDQIVELVGTSGKRAVTARAQIGRLLLEIRHLLPHGSWLTWLRERLPFTPGTAERAIRLHRLSRSNPALFAKLAPVGVAKSYVLVALPAATAEHLLAGAHTVPPSGAEKTLVRMTFSELMEVVAALSTQPSDDTTVLLDTYRRQVRALIRTLDALIEAQPALAAEDDELAEVLDDLLDASARFSEAYAMDAP